MTLQQLRMFSAIARNRSVTNAAQELRISQPAMTRQMNMLQEEFGALYRRTPQGIRLTTQGRFFLRQIDDLLTQSDGITARFGLQKRSGGRGVLTIGGSNGPIASFLPTLASRFRATHPDVEVSLRLDSSRVLETMVESGEIEIAVVTANSNLPGVFYERCRREELVFFASRNAGLPQAELSLTELARVPLVLFKRGRAGATAKFFKQMQKAGIRPNVAVSAESVEAVKNAVCEGAGLGMLYRDSLRNEIDHGEVQLIRVPGLDMRIESAIIHPRRQLSAAAGEFLNLVRDGRREAKAAARGELRTTLVNAISFAALWLSGLFYSYIDSIIDATLLAAALT
jgi:DNA-binding transcriptional LysR family regulator